MRGRFLFMEAFLLSCGTNGGLYQAPRDDIMDGKPETVGGIAMVIKTERLILRPFLESDAEDVYSARC